MTIRTLPKKPKFKLGTRLRSNVSGFEGVATERITHINGCVEYKLVKGMSADGSKIVSEYIYDNELEGM